MPQDQTSTVHSIDVDAVAMYEMMASPMLEENFTILDQDNMPINLFNGQYETNWLHFVHS
jgi:hypothetical protein